MKWPFFIHVADPKIWAPIDVRRWNEVPCVNGRSPTEEDQLAGRAVIRNQTLEWRRAWFDFPACALIHGTPPTPVILISAIPGHRGLIFSARKVNGGSTICEENQVEVFGSPTRKFLEAVAALPPPYNAGELDQPPPSGPYQRPCTPDGMSKVVEVLPDEPLIDLLTEFEHGGGVVEYVPLRLTGTCSANAMHQAAACLTLTVLQRRADEMGYANSVREWSDAYSKRVAWIAGEPEGGREIELRNFLGSGYDLQAHKLLGGMSQGEFATDGYAQAFTSPPHASTKLTSDDLFGRLNRSLFGSWAETDLQIFSWPTNCSKYFEAGLEWWGAHFWTVHNLGTGQLCGITASTTD